MSGETAFESLFSLTSWPTSWKSSKTLTDIPLQTGHKITLATSRIITKRPTQRDTRSFVYLGLTSVPLREDEKNTFLFASSEMCIKGNHHPTLGLTSFYSFPLTQFPLPLLFCVLSPLLYFCPLMLSAALFLSLADRGAKSSTTHFS